jgi:hypothetical protein
VLAGALTLGAGPVRAEFLNPADFTSLGAFPSGTITINTLTNTLTNGVVTLQGVFSGNTDVFTFDSIPSLSATYSNSFNPNLPSPALALLSHGDITVDGALNVSGTTTFSQTFPPSMPGPGGLYTNAQSLGGPQGGLGGTPGRPGQSPGHNGNGGSAGGLVGGAGFGDGSSLNYGGGGGAVELVALRHVTVSGAILASGGGGGGAFGLGGTGGGGGGGGGNILIKGDSVSISGSVSAGGGTGGFAGVAGAGGGGGGGQVQIAAGPGGFVFTGEIDAFGGSGGAPGGSLLGGPGNGGQGGTISIDSLGPNNLAGTFNVTGGAAGGFGAVAGPPGSVTIVPEPAGLTLMALGVLGLSLGCRVSSKNPPGSDPGGAVRPRLDRA